MHHIIRVITINDGKGGTVTGKIVVHIDEEALAVELAKRAFFNKSGHTQQMYGIICGDASMLVS